MSKPSCLKGRNDWTGVRSLKFNPGTISLSSTPHSTFRLSDLLHSFFKTSCNHLSQSASSFFSPQREHVTMDHWPPFDMDPAFIFDVDFGDDLDPEELSRPLNDSEQQPLPTEQTFEQLFSESSALFSGDNLQMLGFGEQGTQASMESDWNNPQGYDTQNAERQQPDHPAPLFTPRISAPFQLPIRTNEHNATMAAYHQAVDPTNHR